MGAVLTGPRLTPEALQFAALRGVVARQSFEACQANPYGAVNKRHATSQAVLALIWRWGLRGAPRRWRKGETVSHETSDPRGDVWPPLHRALLIHCSDHYDAGEIGQMLGRSSGAVRIQRSRMKKAGLL